LDKLLAPFGAPLNPFDRLIKRVFTAVFFSQPPGSSQAAFVAIQAESSHGRDAWRWLRWVESCLFAFKQRYPDCGLLAQSWAVSGVATFGRADGVVECESV